LAQRRARKQAADSLIGRLLTRAVLYQRANVAQPDLERFAIAWTGLWRELFTRASLLIGSQIGEIHKQGD